MLCSGQVHAGLVATIVLAAFVPVGMFSGRAAFAGKPGGGTATTYTLTDLKGFSDSGGIQSDAYGVGNPDATGVLRIVGRSFRADGLSHATVWTATSAGAALSLTDLGTPTGRRTCAATGVNDQGLIVGSSPAFVIIPGVGLKLLSSSTAVTGSRAVNERGDIVGDGSAWHVDALGNLTGPLGLGTFVASDVNDQGLMAGVQDGLPAAAWFDGAGILKVRLLGLPSGSTVGTARGINNLGDVVGESREYVGNSTWRSHAVLWPSSGGIVALGDLGGGTSVASDINDGGQIVGGSSTARGTDVGFVWDGGTMSDLNVLSGAGSKLQIQEACAINATGHIVGTLRASMSGASEYHAYLLTRKP